MRSACKDSTDGPKQDELSEPGPKIRKNENSTNESSNENEDQASETCHRPEETKRKEPTLEPPEGWSDEAREVRDENPEPPWEPLPPELDARVEEVDICTVSAQDKTLMAELRIRSGKVAALVDTGAGRSLP